MRSEDLNEGDGLPQPGTDEPKKDSKGDAGSGPGNVSVDEPTAGALDEDAGTPGGDEAESGSRSSGGSAEKDDDDDDDSTTGDDEDSG